MSSRLEATTAHTGHKPSAAPARAIVDDYIVGERAIDKILGPDESDGFSDELAADDDNGAEYLVVGICSGVTPL